MSLIISPNGVPVEIIKDVIFSFGISWIKIMSEASTLVTPAKAFRQKDERLFLQEIGENLFPMELMNENRSLQGLLFYSPLSMITTEQRKGVIHSVD